jgi:hypothetical protein
MEPSSGSEGMSLRLARMNDEGGFPPGSVLSDAQGVTIVIAAEPSPRDRSGQG